MNKHEAHMRCVYTLTLKERKGSSLGVLQPLKEHGVPEQKPVDEKSPVLEVQDLSIAFIQYTKGLHQRVLQVITNLDVAINQGEILAVVGSSGSGKSLLAHAILGILPRNARVSGKIHYSGRELTPDLQDALRGKKISLIPQSVGYLDPLMRVGAQVRSSVFKQDARKIQREAFKQYDLGPQVEKQYPFQLSGGMARRVLVATAVVSGAELLIADEPTPGLHPELVHEALNHLRELADEGRAVMLITHDIETALSVADKIAVFYAGATVEIAPVADFAGEGRNLRHPYTKALWQALPQNGFLPIPGFQPTPNSLPEGCLFEPRCSWKTSLCRRERPSSRILRGGMVRCIYAT